MQESVPLSALIVQKKRPYFFGRDYTETDVGYLAFFGAMHAIALVGGPLTFSWEALQVGRQFVAARPSALTYACRTYTSSSTYMCQKHGSAIEQFSHVIEAAPQVAVAGYLLTGWLGLSLSYHRSEARVRIQKQ